MWSLKVLCRRVPDVKVILRRDLHKSYYDALGLTPKATQTEIKNAYYKLSMVYHPDKGEGNTVKFQEISTAYEVLSNHRLRQLYDRGLLPSGAAKYTQAQETSKTEEPESSNPNMKSQQQRVYQRFEEEDVRENKGKTRQSGPYTGKTEHYDYDAWTEGHYSQTFAKQQYRKQNYKKEMAARERLKKIDYIATPLFYCTAVLVFCVIYNLKHQDHQREYRVKDK